MFYEEHWDGLAADSESRGHIAPNDDRSEGLDQRLQRCDDCASCFRHQGASCIHAVILVFLSVGLSQFSLLFMEINSSDPDFSMSILGQLLTNDCY